MTIHKICRMGHPSLRATNQDVQTSEFTQKAFKTLIQDMIETMESVGGIGLAAPQIEVNKRLAIIQTDCEEESSQRKSLLVIANPKITILDTKLQGHWEGCLSVPGLRGYVERPRHIHLDYQDEQGEKCSLEAEDFLATVFQHELDHLSGILYTDRISDPTKFAFEDEFSQFNLDETDQNE